MTNHNNTCRRMKRWLLAQKLALAAFYLMEKSDSDDEEAFDCARDHVGALLEAYGFVRFLHTLPPTTINLLWRTRRNLSRTFREPIEIAYQTLILGREDQPEGCPTPSLAAILASVILYGTGDARRVARLGQSLFRKSNSFRWCSWRAGGEPKVRSWKSFLRPEESERTGFSATLLEIRDLNATAQQRLAAAAHFCEIIDGAPWCEQVENALFHQCFSWPLVVSEEGAAAIALPLLVDAHVPQEARLAEDRRRVNRPAVVGTQQIIDITHGPAPTFYDWLWKASQAAHDLWRAHHGSTEGFRDLVADFTARFDFTFASDVVRDSLPGFDLAKGNQLRLVGGSASAYLAQVLLSRLLARRGYMNTVITGEIGERIEHEDFGNVMLDYHFDPVGQVQKKLRYVFDAGFTDVIIAPMDNADEIETMLDVLTRRQADQTTTPRESQQADFKQTAQVNYGCEKLSDVANSAQAMGWRRTQYIRCPDVGYKVQGWKFARRKNEAFVLKQAARRVLGILRHSTVTVVDLPDDVWPANVGQALEYINSTIREHDLTPEGSLVKLKFPAPSLSWSFIRIVEGEEDAEFWQIVWQAIGAPLEEFEQFCCSPTSGIAAEQLIRALNKFVPELDRRSHRAPDVVVLVGFDAVCREFNECNNPASRPLAPAAVIREIKRRQNDLRCALHRSQIKSLRVWEALKNVRILLMSDNPWHESQDQPKINEFDENTRARLQSLAVFDDGFTHNSAAMVLSEHGIRSGEVKETLRELKAKSDAPILGEFGGEYFIPAALRKDLRDSDTSSPAVQARRHRAAGRSLAPYTIRTSMPGIPLERALLPANVVAARKHFQEALRLRQKATKAVLQSAAKIGPDQTHQELLEWKSFSEGGVKNDLQTTDRAALWPGQGLIEHLIERHRWDASADAQYLVEELIDGWQNHPLNTTRIPAHPMLWLAAARALAGAEFVYVNHDAAGVAEACRRFEEALGACEEFPSTMMSENEKKWNILHVKCWYAEFLCRQPATIKAERSSDVLDLEIWSEWSFWSSSEGQGSVPAQWLERQGDEERSAREATDRYFRGHRLYGEDWNQFRFKALGAAAVGNLSTPPILDEWINRCDDPFGDVATFALCCSRSKRHGGKTPYKERLRLYWQEAANELNKAWGTKVPGFQQALWAACNAQGLIEKREKTLLFGITGSETDSSVSELDSQRIPHALGQTFREHHLFLRENVWVLVRVPGREWHLGHYIVRRETDTLNIYGPWILLPRPDGWQ